MKKNFLKVAALLIAAMLMVVSCSQEVAPKNENLVNASISIADTRSLSTTGEELGEITYEYKLTHKFDQIDTSSTIVGDKTVWTPMPSDKKLGYVTQGLWKIEVQGKVNGKVVLSGSANHYFNNQNTIAKIFVNPTSGNGIVTFSAIKMQDLDESTGTKYEVKYALTAIDAESEATATAMTRTQKPGYVSEYSTTDPVSVPAGYYRLTISVWGPKNGTSTTEDGILGGITKSIRVLNGSSVIVSGSIEPKDFDKSEVNVVVLEPTGTISKDVVSPKAGDEVKITVSDETNVIDLTNAGYERKENGTIETNDGNVYAVSYIWDVNGEKVTTTTNEHSVTFPVPGPKSVSCAIVYKVKSFGTTYTYVSAINNSLMLDFTVSEAAAQTN